MYNNIFVNMSTQGCLIVLKAHLNHHQIRQDHILAWKMQAWKIQAPLFTSECLKTHWQRIFFQLPPSFVFISQLFILFPDDLPLFLVNLQDVRWLFKPNRHTACLCRETPSLKRTPPSFKYLSTGMWRHRLMTLKRH